MKIIQVIFGLYAGGAERFVVDLSNELAKDTTNEVTILALKSESDTASTFYKWELSDRVTYDSLGYTKLSVTLFLKLYHYIASHQPDVVHFHMVAQYAVLPILFYRKCKYVETIHNQVELRAKYIGRLTGFIDHLIYKHSDLCVVAISDANYKSFYNYYGYNCNQLIYNGRKEPMKSEQFEEVSRHIEHLKPSKQSVVICHVARCHKQKNQQLLFNSFERIIDKGADAILLVVGRGFEEHEAKGYKNVFFLGNQTHVADYLYSSDAFCLSSLWEGMPITLIEAMACSCIPIGTPVSGFIDLVESGVNGYVSKEFTEVSFVAMLEEFISNRNSIDRGQLQQLYRDKLSIDNCAKDYYRVYNK